MEQPELVMKFLTVLGAPKTLLALKETPSSHFANVHFCS